MPSYTIDEVPPAPVLITISLQHVVAMYAGAIAFPLILGQALQLSTSDIAFLISADLFVCGLINISQAIGPTRWLGIRLPALMGVSFTSLGMMLSIGHLHPGYEGLRIIAGSIIGAGIIGIFISPMISRLLRFFPPVVTGTIILSIGLTLMPIAVNWIFGTSKETSQGMNGPHIIDPEHRQWLEQQKSLRNNTKTIEQSKIDNVRIMPTLPNPNYASLSNIGLAAIVIVSIIIILRFTGQFFANIAILISMTIGAIIALICGKMKLDKLSDANWFGVIDPFHFGTPIFDPSLIATTVLILIVVMIENTGVFLAIGQVTNKQITPPVLERGLRTVSLGALIGGIFNGNIYTSYAQNVGILSVTGNHSRYIGLVGGIILILMGLIPKMSAVIAAIPPPVLGGAGLFLFGIVATTGIRILANADLANNRNNAYIVALSLGIGMIPLLAPHFKLWMPPTIYPLLESGILLTSICAVTLNALFNHEGQSTID